MWTPNYDQLTGIIRAVAPAVTAWLVAQNQSWAASPWGQVGVAVAVTAAACVWSYLNNKSGKVVPSTLSGR